MAAHEIKSRFVLEGEQKYRSAMTEAANAVKVLNSEQKLAAAQFKQTGDAEKYAADQSRILKEKIEQQKTAVKAAEQAIKQMTENGVAKNDRKMQQWQEKLNKAQTELTKMQTELQGVGGAMDTATQKTDKMNKTLESIGKKVNLDAVINGVGKISGALEKAAQKAAQMGQAVWDAVMDSAERADNTATAASILGMDIEEYQKYAKVFATTAELTVGEWMKAKQRINSIIYSPSNEQTSILEALGISTHKNTFLWDKNIKTGVKNYEDLFWEIGETLRAKVQSGKITQGLADDYANAIFGKSWANLNPIFNMGRNAFEEALAEQTVVSEDAVNKLAELNDTIIKLQGDFKSLQDEVTAGLAPALQGAAEVLSGLLNNLTEYLKTDEGQEALRKMEESVSGLFEDLGKIDPKDVVNNFIAVFDKLVKGFEWITEHKEDVINALKGIVEGWAALKLGGAALQIWQMISGLNGFVGGGGSAGTNLSSVGGPAGLGGRAGTGLNFVNRLLTSGAGNAAGVVTVATNATAVGDYLVNNTRLGQEIRDTGDVIGSAEKVWNEKLNEIRKNAETFVRDWGNLVQQAWEASYFDDYVQSVGTTATLVKQGAEDLGNWIWGIVGDAVTDFVTDTVKDVVNTPEAVKQVTNATPEQNRNAFQTIIDTFLNGMQEGGGGSHGFDIPVTPELEEGSAAKLQEEASKITVQIGARIVPVSFGGGGGGGGAGKFGYLAFHANGIWDVPFDGYPAILHRGERVMPAREVSSRSYNSNLYVEKMYMNNGTDAEGLASAMAAAQRRRMSGYGS